MIADDRKSDTSNRSLSSLTWSRVKSQPPACISLSAIFIYRHYCLLEMKTCKVWALTVSLATTPAIVIYFLFLNLLRCFSSVGSRQISYFIQVELVRHDSYWVSPFGNLRINRLLTATRSLSQSSTSFIGNIRLGIHFVPLSTFLCIDLTSNC